MKTSKNIMMLTLWSLLLVGCGYQTVSLDNSKNNVLKGKTVTYVHKKYPVRPATRYSSLSLSPTLYAVTDAMSSSISYNQSRQAGGVVYGKPSEVLSKKIITFLSKKYHMKSKSNQFYPIDTEQIPNYSQYNSDYVLGINTYWTVVQTQLLGYTVSLRNDIKLVNIKTQKIGFQYSCEYDGMMDLESEKNFYSRDELFALNGEVLKNVTSRAISICLEEIQVKALK